MNLQEALKVNENIKIRRKTWVSSYYLTVVSNAFIDPTGTHSPLGYTDIIADNWEVYVEPKPCKHEPDENHFVEYISNGESVHLTEMLRMMRDLRNYKCKHCGLPIKATGWVEA